MIVGYCDMNDAVYCTECWSAHAAAGAHPGQVLQSEEAYDPGDNFWTVDECTDCRRQVKYKGVDAVM